MWILSFLVIALQCSLGLSKGLKWVATDNWDLCSPSCGPGIQKLVLVCVKHDSYNTTTLQPDRLCGSLPSNLISFRPCNWGDCERKTRWRASNWSACSQSCGNMGYTTREVECVMEAEKGEIVISKKFDNEFCDPTTRPQSRGVCNRFNCPAEFHPLDWLKCEQKDPCKSGLQTRKLTCHSLTALGDYVELPKTACYLRGKPPPSTWRRCFIPEISAQCTQNPPAIEQQDTVVVQMRAVRKLQLQVGQRAYVLPGTRLSIKCPVKFFPSSDLLWRHSLGVFSYHGDSVNEKTQHYVSKSGSLVIRRFAWTEEGEWRCQAGNSGPSASVMLYYNLPSKGLVDWEARSLRYNPQTQNRDDTAVITRQKLVQWVEGPWSNCSVHCGGQGVQTRMVRCELLDTGVYNILKDEECERQLLGKRRTQRVCINLPKCPIWKLINADYSECTDECTSLGRGTYRGRLACMLGDVEIPVHHCERISRPDISCENPSCQVKWAVSGWSKCSVSCGGSGHQYRELKCVWAHTGRSAGSTCYDAQMKAPLAVRQCRAKPCKTLCIDLMDDCSKFRYWCVLSTFKYNCCNTCRNYALRLGHTAN